VLILLSQTGIVQRKREVLVRFQVLTAASMKFRIVFLDVLPCKIIVDRRFSGSAASIITTHLPDNGGSTYL
jgi:hypothetical protein